jgi:hypothetical protein
MSIDLTGIVPVPKWLLDQENAATAEAIVAALPFGELGAVPPGSGGTVVAPTVTGASPPMIPDTAGMTTITLTGTGFSADTQISVEGEAWGTTPVTLVSATRLNFKVDIAANYGPGPLTVYVRNDRTTDAGVDGPAARGTTTIYRALPSAPWNAFATLAEFDAWKAAEDPQVYIPWANFGLKSDGSGGLDPNTSVQAAKDAINASATRYFFDPTNPIPPAGFTITAALVKDPASTATDRKGVCTVTFPADKAVGSWALFTMEQADGATPADAGQAEQIKAGQTTVTFNVTYGKDKPGGAAVYVGKGCDTATGNYPVNKPLPALTFP